MRILESLKKFTVKKALEKGENLDEKYSWTIRGLVDLKVVYIITYAYITIVNLISSTANSEATSDADSMALFNVTLSPEHINVEVDSISDAILWSCRRESMSNYYYVFLYYMLIVAMSLALLCFLVSKLTATVYCLFYKYGLTKLWQIAILEELNNRNNRAQQSATGNLITPRTDNQHGPMLESQQLGQDEGHDNDLQRFSQSQRNNATHYNSLFHGNVTDDMLKDLKSKNYCRLVIPVVLPFLSVAILALSYLSYDLHPLACLRQPEEEFIKYNETTKRVELEFSDRLTTSQKTIGLIVTVLTLMYLLFAWQFTSLSKQVSEGLRSVAGSRIDEIVNMDTGDILGKETQV